GDLGWFVLRAVTRWACTRGGGPPRWGGLTNRCPHAVGIPAPPPPPSRPRQVSRTDPRAVGPRCIVGPCRQRALSASPAAPRPLAARRHRPRSRPCAAPTRRPAPAGAATRPPATAPHRQ